jgi:hypothetical protein
MGVATVYVNEKSVVHQKEADKYLPLAIELDECIRAREPLRRVHRDLLTEHNHVWKPRPRWVQDEVVANRLRRLNAVLSGDAMHLMGMTGQ